MSDTLQLRHFAEVIRLETLKSITAAGAGHIGGSMSIVETLTVAKLSENPSALNAFARSFSIRCLMFIKLNPFYLAEVYQEV